MSANINELNDLAKETRRKIFKTIYEAGGGHIAPALSCVEVLTTLYFGDILKYKASEPEWEDRDRFILSKGHACVVLYSVLSMAGYFDESLLKTFCKKGSILGGHPNMMTTPGVEASTGALGHGLLFGVGIALAAKMNKKEYQTYVLLGDGECQEGSIWESALFAAQNKLDNITAIIDHNKFQAMDRLEKIINMESMSDKWKAFGWDVIEVDGHDIPQLISAFKSESNVNKPKLIVANTVKGKGVSFMENMPLWHCRGTNEEETKIAIDELQISFEEMI